jgi:hypothetical protein
MTGNLRRARKKKMPDPKASLSNLEDWLSCEEFTAQLLRSFSGILA